MDDKKTILVIDDEPDLVRVIKFRLLSRGYDVITAKDGVEGLEGLEKIRPDLIILDITMPKMGGLEFYSRITTYDGRSRYPVLVLTARKDLEATFKNIQADGFLVKPFEIEELIREVERLTTSEINPVILLVDFIENEKVQEITQYLRQERYTVVNVEDFAALRNAARNKNPDYIIMEYMQKKTNGPDFITRIKNDINLNQVPIVVYSYSGFPEYAQKSIMAGANIYIGKPENYQVFIKVIRELQIKKKEQAK